MLVHDDELRMTFPKKEFEASLARINALETENQELKQEVARLKVQVNTLKAHDMERKSMLWKKLQNSMDSRSRENSPQKPRFAVEIPEQNPGLQKLCPKDDFLESAAKKDRSTGVPKPPPRPKNPTLPNEVSEQKLQSAPTMKAGAPPPPPPPMPTKLITGSRSVRRVPEVMEFYRLLMKRDAQRDKKASASGTAILPAGTNSRNMIGEIENRSTYLSAIKADVEMHGEFINYLSGEVETAAFTEISEVEAFVKWLDGELSCLVDERAVLKHFPQWPERKADALREAAFSYRDLKNLEYEVSSFRDNPKQQFPQSLRRMQALQDRLERSVNNTERLREGTSKRYKDFHIPWQWMLDGGLIGRLKISSLTLAKQYMRRMVKEININSESSQEEQLLLEGVRFASRVHQFAGGFDSDAVRAFEELRKIATSVQKQ